MKRIKRLLCVLLCVVLCSSQTVSCKENEYDYSKFFGICELTGDFGGGVDAGLTGDWIADMVDAMNFKSFRIWISFNDLFMVDENDDIEFNMRYLGIMRGYVDKLVNAGVEQFLMLCSTYLYPIDYVPSDLFVVPHPEEEYEDYIRFLNLQAKAYKKLVQEFPMLNNLEPGNEPDLNGVCIHKNGFTFGGSSAINAEYKYTDEEQTKIIADLCWYVRRAVKEVDPNARVVLPALTNFEYTPDYLELIYKGIESKKLPAGQTFSDVNPDNYFDILNWHPYTLLNTEGVIDQEWINLQKKMYEVATEHGDGDKPVWFSEIGWSDWGNDSEKEKIGDKYVSAFDTIKKELPFVEVVFVFRLTSLFTQNVSSAGEMNFGIFYNPQDPVNKGAPKPAAISIAKYINGEDYDLTPLYKYCNAQE